MSSGLRVKLDRVGEKIILRVEGRVDASTLYILEEKIKTLIQENRLSLLIDLAHVNHISSSAIRLFVEYTKKLKQLSGLFILFSLQEDVLEVLQMASLDKELHIASSEKKALQTKV